MADCIAWRREEKGVEGRKKAYLSEKPSRDYLISELAITKFTEVSAQYSTMFTEVPVVTIARPTCAVCSRPC